MLRLFGIYELPGYAIRQFFVSIKRGIKRCRLFQIIRFELCIIIMI